MTTYYVVVHEKTGRLLAGTSRLPIYKIKRVAKQTADRYPGYVVNNINSNNLSAIIEDQHKIWDKQKMVEFCQYVCTSCWRVEFEWVINGRRNEERPVMKKILYLVLVKKFPGARLKDLANIMGHKDHAGAHHSMARAKKWLSVGDPLLMKYYEPVKHLLV